MERIFVHGFFLVVLVCVVFLSFASAFLFLLTENG